MSDRAMNLLKWFLIGIAIGMFGGAIYNEAHAGSATVSYTPATKNTDNSDIPATGPFSLGWNRIEYGMCNSGAFGSKLGEFLVPMPATSVEFQDLAPGNYAFRGWSRLVNGTESNTPSNVACKSVTNPNNPPVLNAVANQTGTGGQPDSLQLVGSDPDGTAVSYSATGLPPTLTVNATTGFISGTLTTVGVFNVQATVSDGSLTASRSFTWTVNNPIPNPPVLVTVTTQAYMLKPNGNIGKLVGTVPLNTPCEGPLVRRWADGTTFYEIPLQSVTLNATGRREDPVFVVGKCAATS